MEAVEGSEAKSGSGRRSPAPTSHKMSPSESDWAVGVKALPL